MTVGDEDLHAFLDGELDDERAALVRAALARDPAQAARLAAFRADKQRMMDVFGPVADRALPASWPALARGRSASPVRRVAAVPRRFPDVAAAPRRFPDVAAVPPRWRMAAAAAILLAFLGSGTAVLFAPRQDTILADAAAARDGTLHAEEVLSGDRLPGAPDRDWLLAATVGLPVKAPDLSRFGYKLISLEVFGRAARRAAGLTYRNAASGKLTIYLRKSSGQPSFDLLRRGRLRVCIWQDDVVGAVMTGDMSAGEMMRIASRAYGDLDL